MPALSFSSRDKLNTCHPKLVQLMEEVASKFDITILCGERDEVAQSEAVLKGTSKVHYPNSKHNKKPSMAVDVAPYPIDWTDLRRFYYLGGYVKRTAEDMGIKIRWGGDWNGNYAIKDQNFNDLPHFELMED